MKNLIFILSILATLSMSCTKEIEVPVIQYDTVKVTTVIKQTIPVAPEIATLSKAFVGDWKTSVLYFKRGGNPASTRHYINNPIGQTDICKKLDTLFQSHDLVQSYNVIYRNDSLLVTKTYICSNKVEKSIWEIKLNNDTGVYYGQLFTEHPFLILEKDSKGVVLVTYRMIFFNINKFPNDPTTPKNLFRSDVIYDYREQNPKPSEYSIDFNKQ